MVALFAVYLVLLTWIILWKLEVPYVGAAAGLSRPWKLVPFVASGDAGASVPLEVVANVLLFVPFGIHLGMLAPAWRWWQLAGVFVGASLVLEVTQHLISTGSFDTTDVITNTAGGLVGLGLLAWARRVWRDRASVLMTRGLLIGGVIAVLAVAAFIVSPLHYEQPHDVIFPLPGSTRTP